MHLINLCVSLVFELTVGASRELRTLGFLSITGKSWSGGDSCLTAINMAIKDVNAEEDILKDFNLTYSWFDSECHPGVSVYRMNERLNGDPPYVMLLGAGCSIASEATAQVSNLWNITQFSFASTSPILSDRARFPKFFRFGLPDQALNPAKLGLMQEFNWKRVATINQAREFFSAVIDDFVKRTRDTDINIISQEIFTSNPYNRLLNLKKLDARIIITAMYEDKAKEVICAAHKLGLYGSKIVWMFSGWFTPLFWKTNLQNVDCTEAEMTSVVEGAFLTSSVYFNPLEERGIANLTATEFSERYRHQPSYSPDLEDNFFITPWCYDHIWVAALALNCSVQRLEDLGHGKSLDMFTYADSDINDVIFECMSKTSLTGVSGRVVFSSGVDPDRLVKIERIQGGERVRVALYRQDKDPKYFQWIDEALVWKDGVIPRDSAYIEYKELKIPYMLSSTMMALAALGICFSFLFLMFNIIYRNNGYVKMSSSNINNVLLVGCILCYSTVFFNTMATSDTICKARVLSFSLGFTVIFGALFTKTWRVYRIFTNRKVLRVKIKDHQLLAITFGLVALVLAVLITWEFVGPHNKRIKVLTKEMYAAADNIEVLPFVSVCESEYSVYFGWTLYIIEGALLSFGAFLAWETRTVRIPALNDSYQIGLCLYNVVILSAVGLTLTLLLKDQEIMIYGVSSGCLIVGTTVTQVVIFVPKIQAVWQKVDTREITTMDQPRSKVFPTQSIATNSKFELSQSDTPFKRSKAWSAGPATTVTDIEPIKHVGTRRNSADLLHSPDKDNASKSAGIENTGAGFTDSKATEAFTTVKCSEIRKISPYEEVAEAGTSGQCTSTFDA